MSSKSSKDAHNVLQWIVERGEETFGRALEEILSRRDVTDQLAKLARRAAQTKGRVDKNLQTVLHLLNLPSRADYEKLMVKMEHLQGSLVNLSIKVDRLVAAQARKPKRS